MSTKSTKKAQPTRSDEEQKAFAQEFSKRFNELLDSLGVPGMNEGRGTVVARFAESSKQAASNWLSGENVPQIKQLTNLSKHWKFSMDWLIKGVGSMLYDDSDFASPRHLPANTGDAFIKFTDHELPSRDRKQFLQCTQVVDHIAIKRDWANSRLGIARNDALMVEIVDDAMETTLSAGDIAIIDMSLNYIDSNGLFCFKEETVGGQLFLHVRTVYRTLVGGGVIIKCDNPKYADDIIRLPALPAASDLNLLQDISAGHGRDRSLSIVGKVKWTLKKS